MGLNVGDVVRRKGATDLFGVCVHAANGRGVIALENRKALIGDLPMLEKQVKRIYTVREDPPTIECATDFTVEQTIRLAKAVTGTEAYQDALENGKAAHREKRNRQTKTYRHRLMDRGERMLTVRLCKDAVDRLDFIAKKHPEKTIKDIVNMALIKL